MGTHFPTPRAYSPQTNGLPAFSLSYLWVVRIEDRNPFPQLACRRALIKLARRHSQIAGRRQTPAAIQRVPRACWKALPSPVGRVTESVWPVPRLLAQFSQGSERVEPNSRWQLQPRLVKNSKYRSLAESEPLIHSANRGSNPSAVAVFSTSSPDGTGSGASSDSSWSRPLLTNTAQRCGSADTKELGY